MKTKKLNKNRGERSSHILRLSRLQKFSRLIIKYSIRDHEAYSSFLGSFLSSMWSFICIWQDIMMLCKEGNFESYLWKSLHNTSWYLLNQWNYTSSTVILHLLVTLLASNSASLQDNMPIHNAAVGLTSTDKLLPNCK